MQTQLTMLRTPVHLSRLLWPVKTELHSHAGLFYVARLARSNKVANGDGWRCVLKSVIERYHELDRPQIFRSNKAFAIQCICELRQAEGYFKTTRLKANATLSVTSASY